jgi:thiamine biosynthesis lipoprotein
MALQHRHQFEAIGTPWIIETDTPLSTVKMQRIDEIIDEFDQVYSRFRADSLVSRARVEAPGSFVFPDSIAKLYDTYVALERITNGAVNPLVGSALEHWGYDAQYSLKPTEAAPPKPASLAKTIARAGPVLTYREPVLLDIGAIGKGYLIDMVAEYMAQHHVYYVIDAGGDMAISTATPYVIGLEHPLDFTRVIGKVSLRDQSICGSSPNRRAWGEGLHHIIDGTTGRPAKNDIIATWAIANTTMLADALATALFFVSAATLAHHFGDFQHVIMRADMSVEYKQGAVTIV